MRRRGTVSASELGTHSSSNLKETEMVRKKLLTLSLLLAASVVYVLALVSAPVPANACAQVCTGGSCPGGKLLARNHCTGQISCVSFCITE